MCSISHRKTTFSYNGSYKIKNHFDLVYVWLTYFLPTYFTTQFIFTTIHESHYTISTNNYIYIQYFQQKVLVSAK